MSEMTFEDLRSIIVECAGEDEQSAIGADDIDTQFVDIGYDSLALIEASALVLRRFGVNVPDEQVARIGTPRDFLDLVNGQLAGSAR